jgi:hypothetical protein
MTVSSAHKVCTGGAKDFVKREKSLGRPYKTEQMMKMIRRAQAINGSSMPSTRLSG